MIELVYSNKTERLLGELAKHLQEQRNMGAHPLDPVDLVVPNRNMESWVRLGLAQVMGVAANLRFRWLNRFIGDLVAEACKNGIKLADLDTVEAAVLAVLLDDRLLEKSELQPVRRYLHSTGLPAAALPADPSSSDTYLASDGADLRRVQLASRIAFLFQEYSFSRPEMIAAWRGGSWGNLRTAELPFANPGHFDQSLEPTVTWQRALWRAVFGEGGILDNNPPPEGGRWITMDLLAFDDSVFEKIRDINPPTVHIFGVSYVARLFQLLFARLGEIGALRIYALNPCAEFWEDVETHREFFHRLDQELNRRERRLWNGAGESENEDPFGLFEADTPALRHWGRPGREHVRLLGELTDCDFTSAFDDPIAEGGGLLHRLQLDILTREPERNLEQDQGVACPPDETIKLVAAPSVRREVEWVADEIWRLMREDQQQPGEPPLRFSDVAIIVNSAGRDVYLPQIEAVFAACHNLPSSVSDLPGAAGSRLIEAMSLLLKLPFGRFSRAEMLTLMGHPSVIGRFDDLTPDDLAARTEALGIIFGADRSDHAGTYIDEDVYNWDQGIRRLALGAFMTGEKSGDERIFESGSGRWLVEEVSGTAIPAAARFGLLARSLLADARFVRRERLTLTEWARFYAAQIEAYLYVEEGPDERDRLRLLRTLGKLEAMDLGHRVSGRIAAEIFGRTIDSLEGGRGQYLSEGVVVSSFLPMRAIPFRVVFLLGLGEGLFPASGQRDALDLRAARRRAGDVDPSERDRYMFLETLLCTREKLYLSYVRRDEQTGDTLQPSAVVQELLHMLKLGYLGEDGLKALRIEPPLRRYDEDFEKRTTFFDEALVEAHIQNIAGAWHEHARRRTGEEPVLELSAIRQAAAPEAWAKLSEMLALPGEPPAGGAVTATARMIEPDADETIEAPILLSLSALRRFLECPMQGWASAMLGLSETEEDPADQEEEDFEINKMIETVFLRNTILDAAAGNADPVVLYRERAERLRLQGQIPVGALGRVIEKRHIGVLEGWQSLLAGLNIDLNTGSGNAANPQPLQRVRLGPSSRQCFTEKVLPPLVLNIELPGPEKQVRVVPVHVSGLTEGLFEDGLTSIIFRPARLPSQLNNAVRGRAFRYFLRGVVDHALLSAVNAAGSDDRQILICYAEGADTIGQQKMQLRHLDADKAKTWLTAVITDLLSSDHAYLLPCEAAFNEYCIHKDEPAAIRGDKLGEIIKEMAENEWASFSSLWGPVPSPRSYEPLPAAEAVKIVNRRFGPLFEDIIGLEGI
jgi:exodeoxyribonuclease V gamma subunit